LSEPVNFFKHKVSKINKDPSVVSEHIPLDKL
jgi:hypothetical protein